MKIRIKDDSEKSENSEKGNEKSYKSEISEKKNEKYYEIDVEPESEKLKEPAEEDLIYEREAPFLVGQTGVVKFGDSPVESSVSNEGPTEVILNEDYELPNPNSSRILLAKESTKPEKDSVVVANPLPFLGHFTSFDRDRRKPKSPPKVQSRWGLLKIPIRIQQDLSPRRPEPIKIIHPLESEWMILDWVRPHVPVDPKYGRRILHHYPVTGDRKHICKLLTPSGYYQKHKGGGWICRKWTKRPWPRKLVNHTAKEWENAQVWLEKKEKQKEARFKKDFAEVWGGIEGTDDGIMKDTFNTLHKDTMHKEDRKMEMWEQWDLNVFNFIQRQTGDKINDEKYRADKVSMRNTALQTKYCEAVKRRKMFLDIIHEREYDPFEFRDAALKYSDKKMYDPIKHDWDKDKREKIFMGEDVPERSRTREMMSMRDWPEPQFKASLAGRVTCDDELQNRIHLAAVPEKWVSRDVFWNKRFGPEFWHTSFPKGGKCTNVPRPPPALEAPVPEWRGIRIVWDVECKKQRPLQISELNPWF